MNYVPIHLHTMLSNGVTNIDSVTSYEDYIKRAKECNMKAIAFTEHGSIFRHIKKRNACNENGIKYIHGVEAYITETLEEKIRDNYHCCLYAKNLDGYFELNELMSASKAFNRKGNNFYYVPRICIDDIINTSNNIIISTACLGGILNSGTESIKNKFIKFISENKDRCFLEIQHHNVEEQIEYNKYLYNLHKNSGIRLIAGTDTHNLNEEHMLGRKILQKGKGVSFSNEDNWDLNFKSYDELIDAYKIQGSLPMDVVIEAINNTNVLADMVEEYDIDNTEKYPKLYENSEEVFIRKIKEGISKRGIAMLPNFESEYIPRIKEELEVYKTCKSIDYMLLMEKILSDGRKLGNVRPGYGRGSVNGSLIAYLLNITEMDSVKYGLYFFRFMNPNRISLPDIDSDFGDKDRTWIRDYIYDMPNTYKSDIITFNTVKLKGAIRDVGRALDIPLSEVNEICKNIDDNEDEYRNKYEELFKYVDIINGTIVSIGSHPAGVIVSPISLDDNIGTCMLADNDKPVSMIDMKEVDKLNYIKLDLLGLDTIAIINETCDNIGIDRITPDNVDVYDEEVWKDIQNDTTNIFQFESDMAHQYLNDILSDESMGKIKEKYPNIRKFDLFMFTNGIIRPLGESFRNDASKGICRNNGIKELDDMLYETMGYCSFQEQIMQFLVDFCGYSESESDDVRRRISKKGGTEEILPIIRQRFMEYTPNKYNISEDKASKIIEPMIDTIRSASGYGFSKNHNTPYSLTGYIAGWLRHYYPLEFGTAAMNVWTRKKKHDDIQRTSQYIKSLGIKINDCKFRKSRAEFFMDKKDNSIYKGVASIKGFNTQVGEFLYSLRDNQYNSFVDLLIDINKKINRRQMEILIKLDYFAEFGKSSKLMQTYELFNNIYGKKQLRKDKYPHLNEYFSKHCVNETTAMYKFDDTIELLKDIVKDIPNENINIVKRVMAWKEYVGNCSLIDKTNPRDCVCTDIDLKYTPRVEMYCLGSGNTQWIKISKRIWKNNKLQKGDLVNLCKVHKKHKRKKVGDEWVELDDFELWTDEYFVK